MYPYVRGLLVDLGIGYKQVEYSQRQRRSGVTINNLFSLFKVSLLGIILNSKTPLRLSQLIGFFVAVINLVVAIFFLMYKILFFDIFEPGITPLLGGLFLLGAIKLLFIAIIGEYIGVIHSQILRRPHVIEKERINI